MSPGSTPSPFDRVEDVIQDISEGKLVIVTDDEDRENEGDLIMAAAKATPEAINMMIRYGSGIVCVPMLEHQLRRFGLGPMVARNRESQRTDFTVSVDAAEGISTGISAYDRTRTIRILADDASRPEQLVQPGPGLHGFQHKLDQAAAGQAEAVRGLGVDAVAHHLRDASGQGAGLGLGDQVVLDAAARDAAGHQAVVANGHAGAGRAWR